LGAGEVEELRHHGAEGTARHDDRPFGAKRAARADGDRGGERLQEGDPWLHPAPVDQDRLNRLRDAVAANPLRAVARYQPDDERTNHRDQYHPEAERVARRGNERCLPALVEEEIGEQPDEPEQHQGDAGAQDPDADSKRGDQDHAWRDEKVAEFGWGVLAKEAAKSFQQASLDGAARACYPRDGCTHVSPCPCPASPSDAAASGPIRPSSAASAWTRRGPVDWSCARWTSDSSRSTAAPRSVSRTSTWRRSTRLRWRSTSPCASARSSSSTVL